MSRCLLLLCRPAGLPNSQYIKDSSQDARSYQRPSATQDEVRRSFAVKDGRHEEDQNTREEASAEHVCLEGNE